MAAFFNFVTEAKDRLYHFFNPHAQQQHEEHVQTVFKEVSNHIFSHLNLIDVAHLLKTTKPIRKTLLDNSDLSTEMNKALLVISAITQQKIRGNEIKEESYWLEIKTRASRTSPVQGSELLHSVSKCAKSLQPLAAEMPLSEGDLWLQMLKKEPIRPLNAENEAFKKRLLTVMPNELLRCTEEQTTWLRTEFQSLMSHDDDNPSLLSTCLSRCAYLAGAQCSRDQCGIFTLETSANKVTLIVSEDALKEQGICRYTFIEYFQAFIGSSKDEFAISNNGRYPYPELLFCYATNQETVQLQLSINATTYFRHAFNH